MVVGSGLPRHSGFQLCDATTVLWLGGLFFGFRDRVARLWVFGEFGQLLHQVRHEGSYVLEVTDD